MWPDASQIQVGGRRREAQYVVIPSAARPRLVVPRRPHRVAAGAVRQFKTAATRKERLRSSALALLFRAGVHDLLPDRLEVDDVPPTGIDAHLSAALERVVNVALYIGPARAVRKPVLQLLDERGRTFAFAKLGVDPFTDGLVRAEADCVRRLSTRSWRALRVPEILHAGTWNGHELLVQSALPRGQALGYDSDLLHEAMTELAASSPGGSGPLATSAYLRRLTDRLASLPSGEHATLLRRNLDELAQACGDTVLDFGASHGDWTPWNMTVAADHHALVWDWEKFEEDVPVGLDAVHYSVQGRVVLDGATPVDAFAATSEAAGRLLRSDEDRARLVVALYAVDIASRYLVDREEEAGRTRMGTLEDWLAPVLERSLHDLARTA